MNTASGLHLQSAASKSMQLLCAIGSCFPSVAANWLMVVAGCLLNSDTAYSQIRESDGTTNPRTATSVNKGAFNLSSAIDSLENHNVPPLIPESAPDKLPVFGTKYNWSEQQRVRGSIASIVGHAEEAWPQLVKHIDDSRYCLTISTHSDDIAVNLTIGSVCRLIIGRNLSAACNAHVPLSPYGQVLAHRLPTLVCDGNLKKWCEEHSKLPLYELQILTCRTATKKMPSISDASEHEIQEAIAAINDEIAILHKSRKATPFSGFTRSDFTVFLHDPSLKQSDGPNKVKHKGSGK